MPTLGVMLGLYWGLFGVYIYIYMCLMLGLYRGHIGVSSYWGNISVVLGLYLPVTVLKLHSSGCDV